MSPDGQQRRAKSVRVHNTITAMAIDLRTSAENAESAHSLVPVLNRKLRCVKELNRIVLHQAGIDDNAISQRLACLFTSL